MHDLFSQGLQRLGLDLSESIQNACMDYVALLAKWNQGMNLTAITDPEQMVIRHLLDSLAIAPWIKGKHCLDVGSGAGLPGIPLALALPHTDWVLLDARAKKTCFLRQAVATLGMKNVQVAHKRIEDYASAEGFDTIASRAVSDVETLLKWTSAYLKPNGCLLCMTGKAQVLADQLQGFEVQQHAIEVPFLQAGRHVVRLRKKLS
jgi:16S rRNA (guanine527-N7)-methyltransferase